ncbi:MAG: aldehyde dehydrogenase family protein [Myxococcaceae bacterium]
MKRKLLLDGQWVETGRWAAVVSPYDARLLNEVALASRGEVERALGVAWAGRKRLQNLSTGQRREVLIGTAARLQQRSTEMAQLISDESGKPITHARTEVARAVETLTLAAAELARFGGEIVPVDFAPHQAGAECEVRRFPAGVVVGIVPFNFPLNLGVHKVAPALAVGAPIIVKPPPQAPSPQLLLAELVREAGADPAALQVLPCDNEVAEALATDPKVRIVSFTGSAKIGWMLKAKVKGKATLELGGNAGAVVAADADLDRAAQRLAASAFGYAGQVCIKVQRIVAVREVYDAFVEKLTRETQKLRVGDPRRDDTVVGPVIDDRSADRIMEWVDEAVKGGAKVLCGNKRDGRVLEPTVLANVPKAAKVVREEVFGPVAVVSKADDFDAALAEVNDTDYGLQAAVFTKDLAKARHAFRTLEVGGVIIDDAPSFRSDNMPYGGVKGSGLGREGVRYAMEDFTEPRVLLTR